MEDANILLENLAALLVQEMQQQIKIANHVMTGSLEESVESRILGTITGRKIEIWLNDYGIALDQGVPPERIPFTDPSGRGGKSKYIEGLQRFARLQLGITDNRKSLAIAFAIAKKHKRVGMPVAGPTKFIQKTIDATDADIERFAEDWAESIFEAQINAIIENIRV